MAEVDKTREMAIKRALDVFSERELSMLKEERPGSAYRDLRKIERAYEQLADRIDVSKELGDIRCDIYWYAINTISRLVTKTVEESRDFHGLPTIERAIQIIREYTAKISPDSKELHEKDRVLVDED